MSYFKYNQKSSSKVFLIEPEQPDFFIFSAYELEKSQRYLEKMINSGGLDAAL